MNNNFALGFIKEAMASGLNEVEALELYKAAAEDGPYSLDQAAIHQATSERSKAFKRNREKHMGHYLLNPFVGGPVRELVNMLRERSSAGKAGKGGFLAGMGDAAFNGATGMPIPIISGVMGNEEKQDNAKKLFQKYLANQK